jgi:hypothetical protein
MRRIDDLAAWLFLSWPSHVPPDALTRPTFTHADDGEGTGNENGSFMSFSHDHRTVVMDKLSFSQASPGSTKEMVAVVFVPGAASGNKRALFHYLFSFQILRHLQTLIQFLVQGHVHKSVQ